MTILDSITSFLRREKTEIVHEDEELDVEEQLQETRYSLTEMGQQQKDIFDYNELGQTIKIASEGALALKTVATYRRYIYFISKIIDDLGNSDIKNAIIEPNEMTPNLIGAWIH